MKMHLIPPKTKNDDNQWHLIFILFLLFLNNPSFPKAGITANFLYHKADSIAHTINNNPRILQIKSNDVDSTGKGDIWNYKFVNYTTYTYINVHLGLDSVSYDTSQDLISGFSQMDLGWIDSDSALTIAEANGGRQFHAKYDDIQISANLAKDSGSIITEWGITYFSKMHELVKFFIAINSISGSVDYSWETNVNTYENKYSHYLCQNYPNPFNASTVISFGVDKPGFVTLEILDMTGRKVDLLCDSYFIQGIHKMVWLPATLPSGVYFYRLYVDKNVFTRKLIYLK